MSYRKRYIMGTDVVTNAQTGALLVEPTTTTPGLLGDGSDDAWHLTSNATMAKSLYQFTSLEIDEGVVLSAPSWAADLITLVELRCQTPIVLNGSISADAVTAAAVPFDTPLDFRATGGNGDIEGEQGGVGPVLSGQYTAGEELFDFYPILGGGNAGHPSFVGQEADGEGVVVGYRDYLCFGDPASVLLGGFDFRIVVGMDRPYRFAAGGGGSCDSDIDGSGGGSGGGILLIRAPGIIFGPNASISARGGDASTDGTNHDAGGGGGGHVELWTQAALSPAEKARILVTGGEGDANGYSGLDGVTIYEVF